ncbi:MAG TPA: hypothetical protein VLX92_25475 [Kofleriaceae bacterium]|nr:hypothetical protein [Kofleriaceae bacterium]
MTRARLEYRVGEEQNPGNPFGRSTLVIEPDGSARLDHVTRGGAAKHAWTAKVDPAVVERLWAALDAASFPAMPPHPVPAGSTIRVLIAGKDTVSLEWFATAKLDGYRDAFPLLDTIIRQISGDTVRRVPASEPKLVGEIAAV